MSDTLVAKGSDSKYQSHPAGQYVAQCVDTINLGEKVEEFPGTPPKLASKCALVFRTGEKNVETGECIDIAQEFTVSMGEKANLRKTLEQWRGKPYTADQIEEGVPLHKLTGQFGLLTITQKTSRNNRTYAVISAIVGVPKQMQAGLIPYTDYKRADYWQTRKEEYAAAARAFRAANAAPSEPDVEEFENIPVDEDSLPF